MALSGIYIVTLNSSHPVSVNVNDKRAAEQSIKVTKENCKIGKAVDLEKHKKNYFKTFGESNVNFEILATTLSINSIETSLLIALDEYRMIGPSGSKNEWLENISVNDAKVIVSTVFEEHQEHILENFLDVNEYIVQKYMEQYGLYQSDEDSKLSALDLIHLFLELKGLTPNLSEWNIGSLQHNTSRLFRLFQLKALFKAFKIDFNPKSFIDGKFIEASNLDFTKVIENIKNNTYHSEKIKSKIEKADLVATFKILFDYKQKFTNIQNFSSGVYAATGGYLYSYNIVKKSNGSMKNSISEIDSILSNLISPNNDKFTISELVRHYNYPNVNLDDIDMDNW